MARRGYDAHGCDIAENMVAATWDLLEREGLEGEVQQANMESLPYEDGRFAWVTALGLIEYLPDPAGAVRELARVMRRGGHLVVTAPNPLRLGYLTDPVGVIRASLAPPKGGYRRHYLTAGQLRRMLGHAGLRLEEVLGHGFGPLAVGGTRVTSDEWAIDMSTRLGARLPKRAAALLGSNLLALATKP